MLFFMQIFSTKSPVNNRIGANLTQTTPRLRYYNFLCTQLFSKIKRLNTMMLIIKRKERQFFTFLKYLNKTNRQLDVKI